MDHTTFSCFVACYLLSIASQSRTSGILGVEFGRASEEVGVGVRCVRTNAVLPWGYWAPTRIVKLGATEYATASYHAATVLYCTRACHPWTTDGNFPSNLGMTDDEAKHGPRLYD